MLVHVVGNICVDTTFRLDRFPMQGETLNAVGHADGIGGKGANQAIAAARTGAAVHLWAAIGEDPAGAFLAGHLAGELASATLVTKPLPTDRSTILVDAAGENMIVSGSLCAKAFDPILETSLSRQIATGDIVVMQGNLSPAATAACLQAAKSRGAFTILNPSPLWADCGPDLTSVDAVIVNEGEGGSVTGQSDPRPAAQGLIARGVRIALVTLGARGCLVVEGEAGTSEHIAAPPVAVVDTSGAGDVFCGVFAGCLGRGMTSVQSARVAVEAAALSVGRQGTSESCPSTQEIIDLIRKTETEKA
jgi:ribokinase